MTREQLASIYTDWRNNFLTLTGFAEHYGLYVEEADILINLARRCFENKHPEA